MPPIGNLNLILPSIHLICLGSSISTVIAGGCLALTGHVVGVVALTVVAISVKLAAALRILVMIILCWGSFNFLGRSIRSVVY